MELKEFLAQSLADIVRGVEQAQSTLETSGAHINPRLRNMIPSALPGTTVLGWSKEHGGRPILLVEFDVAVTVNEGTETKGGIGVVAGLVTLGTQGRSDQATTAATRIKFAVPIQFPGTADRE